MKIKVLVVFYSRTGTTKRVAEALTASLNCDSEEIIDAENRRGFFGFLKSGYEAAVKKCPPIKEVEKDPSLYDLVVIGTPVWDGTMASPVRTYLMKYKDRFKSVAFFCTMSGSRSNVFAEMESVCEKKPQAQCMLQRAIVEQNKYADKLEQFVNTLKMMK